MPNDEVGGGEGGYVWNWLHDGADTHLEPPKRDEGNSAHVSTMA